nr:hypothetical protein CKG001_14600 [Bdellovibrio sp. CKG001]
MAIGLVIFGTNYTTLAHTRKTQPEIFKKRFLKVAVITVCASFLFSSVVVMVPANLLVKIFGSTYKESFEHLWMGVGVVVSGTIFSVGIQYDMLVYRYRLPLIKYLLVIGLYCTAVLSYSGEITLDWALLLYSAVPLLVSFLALFRRWFGSAVDL